MLREIKIGRIIILLGIYLVGSLLALAYCGLGLQAARARLSVMLGVLGAFNYTHDLGWLSK